MSRLILPPGAVRLLLAMLVVANHMTPLQIGRGAVLAFFVLSGFWVTRLWEAQRARPRLYLVGRVLRIWPLYALTLVFCWVAIGTPVDWYAPLLFGIASSPPPHAIGVEWSLDIELQFYVALPAILYVAQRVRTRGPLVALVIASAVFGQWLEMRWGLVTVFKYLPAFALGIAIARSDYAPAGRTVAWSLAALVLLAALAALSGRVDRDDVEHVSMLLIPLAVPYLAASLRVPSSASDRRAGDLSYSLYLVHLPVIALVAPRLPWETTIGFASLVAVVGLAGWAVFMLVDRPIEAWRHRILAKLATAGAQPRGGGRVENSRLTS